MLKRTGIALASLAYFWASPSVALAGQDPETVGDDLQTSAATQASPAAGVTDFHSAGAIEHKRVGDVITVNAPGPFLLDGPNILPSEPDGPPMASIADRLARLDVRNGWFNTVVVTPAALAAADGTLAIDTDPVFDLVLLDPRVDWRQGKGDQLTSYSTGSADDVLTVTVNGGAQVYHKPAVVSGAGSANLLQFWADLEELQSDQIVPRNKGHFVLAAGVITLGDQIGLVGPISGGTALLSIRTGARNVVHFGVEIPQRLAGGLVDLQTDPTLDVIAIGPELAMHRTNVPDSERDLIQLHSRDFSRHVNLVVDKSTPVIVDTDQQVQTVRRQNHVEMWTGLGSTETGAMRQAKRVVMQSLTDDQSRDALFILRHSRGWWASPLHVEGDRNQHVVLHPMTGWSGDGSPTLTAEGDMLQVWREYQVRSGGALPSRYLVDPRLNVVRYAAPEWWSMDVPDDRSVPYPGHTGMELASQITVTRGGPFWVSQDQFPGLHKVVLANASPNRMLVEPAIFPSPEIWGDAESVPVFSILADSSDTLMVSPAFRKPREDEQAAVDRAWKTRGLRRGITRHVLIDQQNVIHFVEINAETPLIWP